MVGNGFKRYNFFDGVLLFFLSLICMTMLYPFVNLLFISVSELSDVVASNGLLLYPKTINFNAYRYVFLYNNIWTSYKNTLFITIVGTAMALILTTLGAYVLSRKDLPGRRAMTIYIIITMFFGGGLIPTYLNLRNLGLLNSLWVLIIPQAIVTWYMLLERNFFQGIPAELSESARIDGAGELGLLLRIMLPLSLPILATLALFYGVSRWNEYSNAIIYNSKQHLATLQVIIRRMYSSSIDEVLELDEEVPPPTEAIRSATVIFATVPILCVYPFLQKYFAKGIMVGSLKG